MIRTNLVPTIAALLSAGNGGIIGMYIASSIFTIGIAIAVIRYFTFRYEISPSELVIHQGLFGRLHRTIPVERVQNIDLSQNLFHRLLRVADVRVETGSGTEADAVMRVLSIAQYQRLKQALTERRATSSILADEIEGPSVSPAIKESQETELVLALPTRLILVAGFLSNRGEVVAGVLLGLLWQMRLTDSWIPWSRIGNDASSSKDSIRATARAMASDGGIVKRTLVSIQENYGLVGTILICAFFVICVWLLFRTFSAIWFLFKFYGYRLERHGRTLYVHCGLFTKISATIPLGRIQLVSVQRSWLARRFGLAAIRIETAGGGSDKSENAVHSIGRKWFLPVVDDSEVPRILKTIDPRIELPENLVWYGPSEKTAARLMRPVFVLCVIATAIGGYLQPMWGWSIATPMTAFVWLLVLKKSKSRRYTRTDWGVVYRSGLLRQKCSMTFMDKIQRVDVRQSPFDRRWSMASLSLDTAAAGPADHRIQIEYLEDAFAESEWNALQLATHRKPLHFECDSTRDPKSTPSAFLAFGSM